MTPEEAAKKYPNFCKINPDDEVLELYLDNHMLSSFRKCQGYFDEQFLSQPEGMLVSKGRSWSLEFGQHLHKCLEYFYQAQRDDWEGMFLDPKTKMPVTQNLISWLQICSDFWYHYDLDYFMTPEFKLGIGKNAHAMGGFEGALTLFTQYYNTHWRQERLRFVGWELSFGRSKEVIIGEIVVLGIVVARFYYCGRIDLIVDNSEVIGPMDHKSASYFNGNDGDMFKPHDGMQGYVYSVQQMLGEKFRAEGKLCNTMIINHISVQATKNPVDRFKRSYKNYTPLEMHNWLARQRATFSAIYNLIINDETPLWNTEACNMWYFSLKCPYKQLHELPPANREGLIKINYDIKPAWSPYDTDLQKPRWNPYE